LVVEEQAQFLPDQKFKEGDRQEVIQFFQILRLQEAEEVVVVFQDQALLQVQVFQVDQAEVVVVDLLVQEVVTHLLQVRLKEIMGVLLFQVHKPLVAEVEQAQ
jgi:hypothetical protein